MLTAGRISTLVMLLVVCMFGYYFIYKARKGKEIVLRRLPAFDHMDQAVARAAEMGRPVHFTIGSRGSLSRPDVLPQTIAGLSVLSHVAKLAARYGAEIVNTVCGSEILPVCQDVIKAAFVSEGKAEEYRPNMVQFISDDEKTYEAGLAGVFARLKPATNIFVGGVGAEALYLVELGNMFGAFVIGGTARTIQLPFVVAGSDYCLIGEEMFAAGAYFAKDPIMLGSIAGEDLSRYITMALLVGASLLTWAGSQIMINLLKL